MALLVHTLLCLFDEQGYHQMYSCCWFPYSMVEMREFKNVTEKITLDLVNRGKLGPTDLTRATLETAAGFRMWSALRVISDAALFDRLIKKPSIVG